PASGSDAARGATTDGYSPVAPRIPGLPVIGNSMQMWRDPEAFLIDAYHEYGPIFRVRLGLQNYTVLAGPEAHRHFLEHRETGLSRQRFYAHFAHELGSDYFVLSEPQTGERHSRLRRMMKLGFSRETSGAYVPQMIEAAQAAARHWQPGAIIPVMDATARLTFQLYGFVMADRDLATMYADAWRYAQMIMLVGTKLV